MTAVDALICLKKATGQTVTLDCPCDTIPPNPADYLGFVSANRTSAVTPGFVPGVPPIVADTMEINGTFIRVTGSIGQPVVTQEMESVGGCTVTTIESTLTIDPTQIPTFEVFDPGAPGTASNGSTTLDLVRMTEGSSEFFEPVEDELFVGFDGGQTVTFSWPGGSDINAFSESIDVPPAVELTDPDITGESFDIVRGQAIPVAWTPGADNDGNIDVELSTTITESTFGGTGSVMTTTDSVVVICPFSDSGGSGTVPAAVTSRLLDDTGVTFPRTFLSSFTVLRSNTKLVEVGAPGAGGSGTVLVTGTSSATRVGTPALPGY